jgi:type I restriction enzyme S subunit
MSSSMPEGWAKIKLGQIVKLQGGNAFKSSDFREKGIPIVRISNIQNNIVDLSNAVYFEEFKHFENFLISNGDILLAMSGATTGKIGRYRYPFKSYLNQRVGKFQIIKNSLIDFDFLYHLVHSNIFIKNTMIDAIGGAQPNISSSQVEGVFYRIPPLPEQKKIASILTSVDKVIENTQKQIDKLQDLKKATMNELLTKGIGHTEFKDSELGRIPKSWEVNRLINLSEGRFGIVDGPFGSNLKTEHYRLSGIPVIQSGFVTTGHFTPKKYLYVDEEKFQSEIRSSVKGGDIVMAKIGAQAGRCAIMPMNHPIGILAGNSLKISIKKNVLLAEYLHQLLTHLYSTGEIQILRTETAQPAISIATLKRYKIATPSIREQYQIVNTLSSIDFQVFHQTRKLEKTQSLKKSLMQDLLTGKVRVSIN